MWYFNNIWGLGRVSFPKVFSLIPRPGYPLDSRPVPILYGGIIGICILLWKGGV